MIKRNILRLGRRWWCNKSLLKLSDAKYFRSLPGPGVYFQQPFRPGCYPTVWTQVTHSYKSMPRRGYPFVEIDNKGNFAPSGATQFTKGNSKGRKKDDLFELLQLNSFSQKQKKLD